MKAQYRFIRTWLVSLMLMLAHSMAGASTITYYHNDISGSPVMATNESGQILWKETYRPYGKKLVNNILSATNRIGFDGKPFDSDINLSYFGARYYDPNIGRFMGVDPKEPDFDDLQSLNRYSFAANNPYRYVDPDGHSPIDVGFLVWDLTKLATAVYTGSGVAAAAVDVGLSAVGVISPIPGSGQALKLARAADRSVEVVKTTKASGNTAEAARSYQVYIKKNLTTGEVYTGRTSGFGTPLENVARRDISHHKGSDYGPADLIFSTNSKDASRGVEQLNIDLNGKAKSMGGTSGNAINGISPQNPNLPRYLEAAAKELRGAQ